MGLAQEWRKLARMRPCDDAAHWDRRAANFGQGDAPSGYVRAFLAKARLRRGQTVFDMGCGKGALAIPLALGGHSVIAADFSRGMLDGLALRARNLPAHAPSVTAVQLAWGDPWQRWLDAGLAQNAVDVSFASRSLATDDLEMALRRLDVVARHRVCVTVGTGLSPRVDARVMAAMGLEPRLRNDALFVFGMASEMGYRPQMDCIMSPRWQGFASREEALDKLFAMAGHANHPLDQAESLACRMRLEAWLERHLQKDSATGVWQLDQPRRVEWAFISWDKDDRA